MIFNFFKKIKKKEIQKMKKKSIDKKEPEYSKIEVHENIFR